MSWPRSAATKATKKGSNIVLLKTLYAQEFIASGFSKEMSVKGANQYLEDKVLRVHSSWFYPLFLSSVNVAFKYQFRKIEILLTYLVDNLFSEKDSILF